MIQDGRPNSHIENLFLAYLSESSGWAIVITLCPSSVVHRPSSVVNNYFVNNLEVTDLAQSWWNLLRMLAPMKTRSGSKLGQKLGHLVKSKENINTLEVPFFKHDSC